MSLSYLDSLTSSHHPDRVTLAAACERAGADLRVLDASPRAAPARTADAPRRRKYLGVAEEVTQMSNQLASLSTQLEAVARPSSRSRTPRCSARCRCAHSPPRLPPTERHLAAAIARHYVVKRPDDRAAGACATTRAHAAGRAPPGLPAALPPLHQIPGVAVRGPGRAAAGRRPLCGAAGRVDASGAGRSRSTCRPAPGGTGATTARRPQAGLAPLAPHVPASRSVLSTTPTRAPRRSTPATTPPPPPLGHRGRPARRLAAARDGRAPSLRTLI